MCDPISLAIGGAAILGAGSSALEASSAKKAQKKAQQQNEQQAAKDAQRSQEQFNQANQKSPDIASFLAQNQQSANQGLAATFLTGPSGVNANTLSLGKAGTLGGGQ